MQEETRKKIEIECLVCKTKFEIWLDAFHSDPEFIENIKERFHSYCPACKIWEEVKNKG
ncbi:MAG: hypothetical protein ABH831_03040 [Candidatus Nealsonbacteria bacterium]